MPDNHDSEVALNYHNATKHSYASVRNNQHSLDFNNQPIPFKIYPTLEPSPLPAELRQTRSGRPFRHFRKLPPNRRGTGSGSASPNSYTSRPESPGTENIPGGEIYFRAAACTGALYEVELYLVCGDLANLEAGVYHFAAAEFGLRRLRSGDYRGVLIEATANEPAIAHAPLTIVCTCHLLAQCMEVSGPHLPPLRLGQRHSARQPAGRRHRAGSARQSRVRLRGRHGESPARCRSAARSSFLAGAARPRFRAPRTTSGKHRPSWTRNCPALPPRDRLSAHARDARRVVAGIVGGSRKVARRNSADLLPASRRTRHPASPFVGRGNASRPHRTGHSAARLQPQVCPHADHAGATLHHARPRHSRGPRRFPRSCRIAAQPSLPDRARRGRSGARSLRLPSRPRSARVSEAGRFSRPGRIPRIAASPARRRRSRYLLSGRPASHPAALWQSRISRRAT